MSRRRSREWEIRDASTGPSASSSHTSNARGARNAAAAAPSGPAGPGSPLRAVENARRFLWDSDEEEDCTSFYADDLRSSFSDAVSSVQSNTTPISRQSLASGHYGYGAYGGRSLRSEGEGMPGHGTSYRQPTVPPASYDPNRPRPTPSFDWGDSSRSGLASANSGASPAARAVHTQQQSQPQTQIDTSSDTSTFLTSNKRGGGGGGDSSESDRRNLFAALKQSTTAEPTNNTSKSSRASAVDAPPGYPLDSETLMGSNQHGSSTTRSSTVTGSIINFFWGTESQGSSSRNSARQPGLQGQSYSARDVSDNYPIPQGYGGPPERSGPPIQYSSRKYPNRSNKSVGSALSRAVSSFGRSLRQTFVLASANATGVPEYRRGSDTIDYSDNMAAASLKHVDPMAPDFGTSGYGSSYRQVCSSRGGGWCTTKRRWMALAIFAVTLIGVSVAILTSKNRSSPSQQPPQPQQVYEVTNDKELDKQNEEKVIEGQSEDEEADSRDEAAEVRPGIDDVMIGGLDINGSVPTTPSEPRTERFLAMRERIQASKVSSLEDLDYEDGPQYKALNWLANEDGAALSPNDEFLIQRFSLAVLYLSTHADQTTESGGWTQATNWLTAKGHCSWFGVLCRFWNGLQVLESSFDGNGDVFVLNLTSNNVQGSIPPEIMGLEDLRVLDLSENLIEGTIPFEIGSLISLLQIDLSVNGLEGSIPPQVGALSQCTDLVLHTNWLTGSLPQSIGDMTNLQLLALYENSLTGTLVDFSKMKNLEELYIDSNQLSGEISEMPPSLIDLRLGSNNIHGPIDPLFHVENLETLYIEKNILSGTISPFIYRLQKLQSLHAYDNFLSGSIPFMIDRLSDLKVLYLDSNELSGSIPKALPKQLTELYLNDNLLSGNIPPSIARLVNLEKLYLQENRLGGTGPDGIPSSIGGIQSLKKLYLHSNDFKGEMPTDVCNLTYHNLLDFASDCDGDQPEIVCSCCTSCY